MKIMSYSEGDLHCAAKEADVVKVKECLASGISANCKTYFDRTPLHLTTNKEVAEILIQNGADVNSKDYKNQTPLHVTTNKEVVQILIQNGADVNSKDRNNQIPLHVTTSKDVAQILIQNGADVNSKDKNGQTPLHLTTNKEVTAILIQNGADVNSKDFWMKTPLHMTNNKELAAILVQNGADVNSKDVSGGSVLHQAVSNRDQRAVEMLICLGANLEARNEQYDTPLHHAASIGDLFLVKRLPELGAMLSAKNRRGDSPLHQAVRKGRIETVKALVGVGADLSAKNYINQTPLHLAKSKEVAEFLIQKKAEGKMNKLDGRNEQSSAISNYETGSSFQNIAEIAEQKDNAIQLPWLVDGDEFHAMLSRGEFQSYDHRLSLGGPCKVGKSTLASMLIGEEIPLKWNSTDGLVIYFGRNGIDIEKKKMVPLQEGEGGHEVLAKILRGKPNVTKTSNQTSMQGTASTTRRVHTAIETVLTSTSATNYTQDDNDTTKYLSDQCLTNTNVNMNKSALEDHRSQKSIKSMPSVITEIQSLDYQNLQLQSDILKEVRNGQYRIKIAPSDLIDFGGQKSYDMTHQLFIQHKGSFLLMFDGRFGLHKQLDEYPDGVTAASILKHWVDSVLTYTEDTEETRDIMPMIVFAATHRDQCKDDVEKMKQDFIRDIKHMFCNYEKIHHIHLDTVYFINGIDTNDPEIQDMTNQVVRFAMQQSSWGQRRPMQWVPLELQISNMRMKNVNIITKGDLRNVNKLNDDLALRDDQLNDFLLVQHSLGKLMYYNLPGLDNCIIIHPPALVNILRSFVTDEKFFPADQNLKSILETLTQTGKIYQADLFKLWQQDHFHQYMQDDSIKEFIIQLLIHLDILIVPKALTISSTCVYLVPCMIKTPRPDFNNLQHHVERTICLEYALAQNSIPSALAYKVIGAAIINWPLKEENGKPCLYHKAAVMNVSEDDELSIWLEDNRVMVSLTNQKSLLSISPDVAASIQECLTKNIESSLLFYFNSFGKKIKPTKVSELYTFVLGVPCGTGVCFKSIEEVNEADYWTCDKEKKHETKYLLYWIFDKSKKTCAFGCKGLSYSELRTEPSDKHLVRLGGQIGIKSFQELYLHLGMTTKQWDNTLEMYGGHSPEGIMSMALVKWKDSKLSDLEDPSLKDLANALKKVNLDNHVICQVFREETKLLDIADFALQQTPSDGVLKELSKQVGNCALQLGIELGVSFDEIENSLFKFPKDLPGLIEDVLMKWKATSKIKTFHSLMLALKRVHGRGVNYLHKMSK